MHRGAGMIRTAVLADLDRLEILEQSSFFCDGVNRRSMRHFLRSDAAITLLDESDGRLRGHVLVRFNARHRIARIYSIAVAPEFQRQGVGAALVTAAEAAARARGRRRMRLEISVDNAASQALFGRAGYAVFGEYPDYYEDGGAALRLEKHLVDSLP
jgi:ribosomal protein S18 acetylase RimI-like enzyme